MKFSRKIGVVIAVLIILMIGYGVFAVHAFKTNLIDSRKHEIKSILTFAINQVYHFVELERTHKMSREEAEKNVVLLLSNMREGDYFLWANDANGIARVHVKDDVIGVFQPSYAKYIGYLDHNPFLFVVGESKKAKSNNLYVKVNGMTLLPGWNWMLGIGVYIDDLDKEVNRFILFFALASSIIFIILFIAVYWLYHGITSQIGGDPQDVLDFINKAESKGLSHVIDNVYPRRSILFFLKKFYQHIYSVLESLQQQSRSISSSSVELVSTTKNIENLIEETAHEGQRIIQSLSDNKELISEMHSNLFMPRQQLDVLSKKICNEISHNTNDEKRAKMVIDSITKSENELINLTTFLNQFDELVEVFNELSSGYQVLAGEIKKEEVGETTSNMADLISKHSISVMQAKYTLSQLKSCIDTMQDSIKESNVQFEKFSDRMGEQRLIFTDFNADIINIQQQIEAVITSEEPLLLKTPNDLNSYIDQLSAVLVMLTGHIANLKNKSDKIGQDLGSIKLIED